MKKILIYAVMTVLGCGSATAQDCCGEYDGPRPTCGAPYPPAEQCAPCTPDDTLAARPAAPAQYSGDPLRNINVTAEQRAKVNKAIAKRDKKAADMRRKILKERQKRDEEFDREMRRILTPAQYGQYRQNAGARAVRRKGMSRKPVTPDNPDRLKYTDEPAVNGSVAAPVKGPQPNLLTE